MSKLTNIQQQQVFKDTFKVNLKAACTIGNGILRLSEEQKKASIDCCAQYEEKPTFFIPASGSGSRMFQFLFEWNTESGQDEELKSVVHTLSELAVGKSYKHLVDTPEEFRSTILNEMASRPKGLIPFHASNGSVLTAFQEHVLQVKELFPSGVDLHFTIQQEFEADIEKNIEELGMRKEGVSISYSYQSEASNAYCFKPDQEVMKVEGVPLRRPAGHGALLENLNALKGNLVLIKNIDNVQHGNKAEASLEQWRIATGLLLTFEKELKDLVADFSKDKLNALNKVYQFLSPEEEALVDESNVVQLAERPSRVCGMVKNEGEPGGGPFWIHDGEVVTKQIIEKVQISSAPDQQEIVEGSSHFNPVFIVLSKSNALGDPLDLTQFRDDSKFFVVKKSYQGQDILYRELPGLWNGSMSNWNTLFLEIPSEVFSPVKTVLDLRKSAHQE